VSGGTFTYSFYLSIYIIYIDRYIRVHMCACALCTRLLVAEGDEADAHLLCVFLVVGGDGCSTSVMRACGDGRRVRGTEGNYY
jgi:hypothetical protein